MSSLSGIEMYKSLRYILTQNNNNAMMTNGVDTHFMKNVPLCKSTLSVIRVNDNPVTDAEILKMQYHETLIPRQMSW